MRDSFQLTSPPSGLEPGARAWFVVIAERGLVEILDGPFLERHEALRPADLHQRDGERGIQIMLRFVPRRPTWLPLYGPRYDAAADEVASTVVPGVRSR